ncbi:NERD domain-containing protein [Lysinibacillus xylanilyticus]|uniref:nuclease-related domain-containing protein n=1 Tax=Lysinibacillus xylanilyticus TaxID=582475 RepID=UPI002B24D734|nr:nuclease-related domain-containing protein [Lysinibacillus xylanilyticus]MEB2281805.1 NERD domain-containing protein [Lysinibacillus xylanilyticus]
MLIIIFISIVISFYFMEKHYRKSVYYKQTKNNYFAVKLNKGKNGEYLTSKIIERHALQSHRQLLNVYIPKRNSDELTEVDLLYIDRTGLYVIESKNYSGWIFGNETQQQWTQTMPNKKKYKFFNPIRQNATHIRAIQDFLDLPKEAIHSVIVFSERCTLKKVVVTSQNVHVIKRENVRRFIQTQKQTAKQFFSQDDIQAIYNKLVPQMQVSNEVKKQHIQKIQQKYGNNRM